MSEYANYVEGAAYEDGLEEGRRRVKVLEKKIERLEAQLADAFVFISDGYRCSMTDVPTGRYERIK